MTRHRCQKGLSGLLLLGTLLPVVCPALVAGESPQQWSSAEADSLASDLIQIRIERLRQEVFARRSLLLAEELQHLASLIQEADSAFAAGDGDLASAVLLEAEITLEMLDQYGTADQEASGQNEAISSLGAGSWDVSWAFAAGVDAWQQQFSGLGVADAEAEPGGQANPYAALRSSFSGGLAGASLTAYVEGRLSKDYTLVMGDCGADIGLGVLGNADLAYRASWTDYRDPDWIDFWQSDAEIRWEAFTSSKLAIGPRARLLRVVYRNPSEADLFQSYKQSGFGLAADFYPSGGPSVSVRWMSSVRRYDRSSEFDFLDCEFDASFSLYRESLAVSIWGLFLDRDFERDLSGRYEVRSYREAYLDGKAQWILARPWGIDLRMNWQRKDYDKDDPLVPDYHELRLQLGLLWQPSFRTSISVAPVFRVLKSLTPLAGYEDFSTVGVAVAVDLYHGTHWALQFSSSFESRDYQQDVAAINPGLSFYSDRNILDHILLLTWRFQENWELSLTMNWNREDDREWSQDVQSSLFSLQLCRYF